MRGEVTATKTFRVFVSSTFSDFVQERNALQRFVFQRIAELCARRGARFQAIDLRWGVTEEAELDQRTVQICLDEIDRCQRLSPQPNFIILLGDRYGWRPLPAQIEKLEFETLLKKVPDVGVDSVCTLLRRWYLLDENAMPSEYVLQPREVKVSDTVTHDERKAAQDAESASWRAIATRMRLALLAAVEEMHWPSDDPRRVKYLASATEQEILRGLLEMDGAERHVFCFSRAITMADGTALDEAMPDDDEIKDFIDYLEVDGRLALDRPAHDRLPALREKVFQRLGDNTRTYTANWIGSGITLDHIGDLPDSIDECLTLLNLADQPPTLCGDAWRDLSTIILSQLAKLENEEAVAAEVEAHQAFGESRIGVFVGREQSLKAIAEYLHSDEARLLALVGEPGSGKSTLMAKAFEQARAAQLNTTAIIRYIGATPTSTEGQLLLFSLCRQIARAYGADESAIPTAYDDLESEFPNRLMHAMAGKPLILFIDALDQLRPDDQAGGLQWLPTTLPDHVRLVVSVVPGDCEVTLSTRNDAPRFLSLDRMTRQEGDLALGQWLSQARRTLRDDQRREVLDRFELDGRPLYLKLAFEEARLWRSNMDPELTRLEPNITGLITKNLFDRLKEPRHHGRILVAHALGYLAASRSGLAEDELIELLSADEQVKDEFHVRSPKSPYVEGLPVVIWSRLYFDIKPYLSERFSDGTTLLAFYHREIQAAATREFLCTNDGATRHLDLARYFQRKADPGGDCNWSGGSVRGLAELPFQLAMAGAPDALGTLHDILTDYLFLHHKLAEVGVQENTDAYGNLVRTYNGVHYLRDDIRLALSALRERTVHGRKPLIVTAVDYGTGPEVLCPWCTSRYPLQPTWQGSEIACIKCQRWLRINEFIAEGL